MVIGVDYSTYEAVLCGIPFSGGKPKIVHARFRPARACGDAAAIAALTEVAPSIRAAMAEFAVLVEGAGGMTAAFAQEPHVFFVERGFGMSRKSDWALGAFFAAVYVAVGEYGPANAMDLREWKSEVTRAAGIGVTARGTGNGNAKKEVANEAARALLGLVEVDGTGWTADELDAYGLAFTGRRLNARAAAAA